MNKKIGYNVTKLESVHARIVQLSQNYKKSTITARLLDGKLLVMAELPDKSFFSAVRTAIMKAAKYSQIKHKLNLNEKLSDDNQLLTITFSR